MATSSHIEWTEYTWNPVTGCTKISQGCKHCYAERMAARLHAMQNPRYRDGFKDTNHNDLTDLPRTWKKGRLVFVNSMSDMFHEDVPLSFISRGLRDYERVPTTHISGIDQEKRQTARTRPTTAVDKKYLDGRKY